MGLWTRFLFLFRAKATSALDRAEDPRETLDFAFAQQQELLRKVREGLVEVATSKRQIEAQTRRIQEKVPHLEDQARRSLAAGREDLARLALQRRQAAVNEMQDLHHQVMSLAEEQTKLTGTEQALSARVDEFRGRRNALTARYTAAEAQVRVQEALTGVSGELAELGMALGRAEEKMERMQARASALAGLIEPGALDLPGAGDEIERELRQVSAGQAVEAQLEELRAELGTTSVPLLAPGRADGRPT